MATKEKVKEVVGRKLDADNPLAGHKRYTKIRTLRLGSYGLVLLALDSQTREKASIAP